jgi:AcrR family transcriptional regulator
MSRTIGSTAGQTRARILDVARDLFAAQGYAGTSIRDIAERVDITKAALYYHFPGKADILLALVEPLLGELDALSERTEREGVPDRAAAIRAFVALLARSAPAMISLFSDPTAKRDVGSRLGAQERFTRLERALATGDGDLLSVRCGLGAAHSGVLATLAARAREGNAPVVTADELERVIRASLAAWDAAA